MKSDSTSSVILHVQARTETISGSTKALRPTWRRYTCKITEGNDAIVTP